jgi:ketosteroid isomerase-like protein
MYLHTKNPAEFAKTFEQNFNTGVVDHLLSNYLPEAVLYLGSLGKFTGHDQIRAALSNFLSSGLPIRTTPVSHTSDDQLAVVVFDWQIDGIAKDGKQVKMNGRAVDVLERDAAGDWKHRLDMPFGAG